MGHVDEQEQVRRIAERVDASSESDERLRDLAQDISVLLESASSLESIDKLLELIADRRRAAAVLHKFEKDKISRTGLLSFISEQRWPESVRRRVSAMTPRELAALAAALETADVSVLERQLC
jgi:hypothetical protein